jgi:hypothetical protein
LLGRGLKIARLLGSLAHYLYGIHYILLLVVIGIAKRGRPAEVLVHISKDRWKCGERFYAWVPGLLVDSLAQCFVF